jgi:hypothetical protein
MLLYCARQVSGLLKKCCKSGRLVLDTVVSFQTRTFLGLGNVQLRTTNGLWKSLLPNLDLVLMLTQVLDKIEI